MTLEFFCSDPTCQRIFRDFDLILAPVQLFYPLNLIVLT